MSREARQTRRQINDIIPANVMLHTPGFLRGSDMASRAVVEQLPLCDWMFTMLVATRQQRMIARFLIKGDYRTCEMVNYGVFAGNAEMSGRKVYSVCWRTAQATFPDIRIELFRFVHTARREVAWFNAQAFPRSSSCGTSRGRRCKDTTNM